MSTFTNRTRWSVLIAILAFVYVGCGGGGGGGGTAGGGNGGGDGGGDQTPVASSNFNMIELAGFGEGFSAGIAINGDGLAVGLAADGTSVKGAKWLVDTGIATAQGTRLNPLAGNDYSAAYGVNADGVAVGESGDTVESVADARSVAVYWPDGATTPVALRDTGLFGGASAAFGINDGGEIVGEAVNDAAGNTVAVYWADIAADPVRLGNLPDGSFSSAYFIGADGSIVGEAQNADGRPQAVVWIPGTGGTFAGAEAPIPLQAVTDQAGSVAFGVDFDGRIVGEVELGSGVVQGVIWNADGTVETTLGAGTSAQAVNNDNRIVGYSDALSGNDRAFIWNGANISDLKSLSDLFSQAYGINDANQVVGIENGRGFAALPQ